MNEVGLEKFLQFKDGVTNFLKKVRKEPLDRRERVDRVNKLRDDKDKLEDRFKKLKNYYNSCPTKEDFPEVKACVLDVETLFWTLSKLLQERLESLGTQDTCSSNNFKMEEKFELRTASSLLPNMDGSEEVTKQLIDTIEWYESCLNAAGKVQLINFVLKTKLSQNAKLRLGKSYNTVGELVREMKKHLLADRSAVVLATELHSMKQGGKTIDEFGKSLEEVMLNLTLAQARDDDSKAVLQQVNEKAAVSVFSNGLRNSELRTIVKARNYNILKDAILGAKDEESVSRSSAQPQNLFQMRPNSSRGSRGNFNNFRGRDNRGTTFSRGFRRFSNNNNYYYTPRSGNDNYNNRNQQNFNTNSNNFRGRGNFARRPRGSSVARNRFQGPRPVYSAELADSNSASGTSPLEPVMSIERPGDRFFRS